MKAAIYDNYGDPGVLRIGEVDRPEPGPEEVLVQVFASPVTTADWRLRAAAFPGVLWLPGRLMVGLFRPRKKVLGAAFAGRVVAVGEAVSGFRMGDRVFGFSGDGAHAEYLAMPAAGPIAKMPTNLSYEEAAAVPFAALAALVFLRDYGKVGPGQKVLVAGASGGVGVFAVQLARHFGAEVTGIASSGNLELVRSLGADTVIDYTKEDYAARGDTYDVVLDTAGTTGFAKARRVLKPGGIFIPLEFGLREMIQAATSRLGSGPSVAIGVSGDSKADLETLKALLEKGTIRPVVDSRYRLDEIAAAHRRVEGRHKTGEVVITLRTDGEARLAAE